MIKLDLTAKERVALTTYVNDEGGGDIKSIRRAIKILDKLELSEEERKEVGIAVSGDRIIFKNPELLFEIEFEDYEFNFIKKAPSWNKWLPDKDILELLEKIENIDEHSR